MGASKSHANYSFYFGASNTNIEEIKNHNVDDVIQLGERGKDFPENIKSSNFKLAKLMENFMIKTNFVRIPGPYRDKEFGGSEYGHASKLLEHTMHLCRASTTQALARSTTDFRFDS